LIWENTREQFYLLRNSHNYHHWIYDLSSNFSSFPISQNEKWYIIFLKWDTNASMTEWKVFIDKNNDWKLEENLEPFQVTDDKWYYRFDNLEKWSYIIAEVPHQNWNSIKPNNSKYNFYLNNWQSVINLNFENNFIKWKSK